MTEQDATERMGIEGLTYTDAVMLVASAIPEGKSKVWTLNSQEYVKERTLKELEKWRKRYGTVNFNLKECYWQFGIKLLREFG